MKNLKLIVSIITILLSALSSKSFAQRIYAPNTVRDITSARNYCQNATASSLRFRYYTCNTGSGTSSGIAITVNWYSNTTNSTSGGTLLSSTNSNSTTNSSGNLFYLPPTNTIGVIYYYCTITWTGAGSCRTSGTLTSPVTSVTVGALPAAIGGSSTVCVGSTTTLTNTTAGGTWRSSSTSVASIGLNTGVVSGVASGTTTISYRAACGSRTTKVLTVSVTPTVAAISGGTSKICVGSSTTLTNSTSGGVWSSDNTGVATVNASGSVTGVASGTATISYTRTTCATVVATKIVTVTTTPAAISGTTSTCNGYSLTYSNTVPFGTWSSSNAGVASINSNNGTITTASAGTTRITYSTGCGTAATQVLTVNAGAAAITGTAFVCTGNTTTLSNSVAGGTWSSSIGAVASVNTTGVVTGIAAGTTVVSYNNGACSAIRTVTVSSTPSAITGDNSACTGNDLSFSNTIAFGTWSSSTPGVATINSTTGLIDPLTNGTTTITYNTGCGTNATKVLTVNNQPAAITGTTTVCASNNTTLSNSVSGGVWSSSNNAIGTVNSSTGIVTGIAEGNVTISYTNNTCFSTINVSVSPLPDAGTISGTTNLCEDELAAYTSSGDDGTWTSSNTSIATIDSEGDLSALAAGTTTISYSTTNSCGSATTTKIVTVNASTDAGVLSGTATVCPATTTSLSSTISGGVWSSTNTSIATVGTSGIVTGVAQGNATISYVVTNGCGTDFATQIVTVNPLPNAGTITGTAVVCPSATTTLANAQAGGVWTSSNTAIATIGTGGVVAGVAQGNTTISYAVTNSCVTAYATQVVTVNPLPNAGTITGTAVVCPSATTTLANAQAGGVWTSSNAAIATVGTGGVVTGIAQGNATISYAVTNSCGTAYATQVVTVNPLPNAGTITGTAVVCPSATTALTNAQAGGVWTSSNAAIATVGTGGVVTGVAQGNTTISYAVTNSCGTAYATQVVTVNPLPNAGTITGSAVVCPSATTTLANAPAGGVWTSSNTAIATVGTGGVVTGVAQGNTTISYAVTNSCGTAYATQVVTVNPLPNAGTITGTAVVCRSATTTLANAQAGGVWTSSNAAIATVGTGGVVTGVAQGNATISYAVTNSCGTAYATQVVTVNALPNAGVISGSTSTCAGSIITLTNAQPGGAWTSSNTGVATIAAGGILSGASVGTTTISYTVTNVAGCSSVATRVTSVNAQPSLTSPTGTFAVCQSASIILTTSGTGGVWSSSNTAAATIGAGNGLVSGIAAGTTNITYNIGTTGCRAITVLTVNTAPSAISNPAPLCPGETATMTALPAGGTWTSNNPAVMAVNTTTGEITGVIQNFFNNSITFINYITADGCSTSRMVTVKRVPAPIYGGVRNMCTGETTTLLCGSAGNVWSSATPATASVNSTGVVTSIAAGTTTISYTNTSGCASTTTITVNSTLPANTGIPSVCSGETTTLSNATAGGTWSKTGTAATINSLTGVVTGINAGTVNISYRIGLGCYSVTQVTVNSNISPIGGTLTVCEGTTTTLTYPATNGTWSSSNTAIATINPTTGLVSGIASGTTTISYIMAASCYKTAVVTVSAAPAAITGTAVICQNTTTMLSSVGGTWSSSNTAIATVIPNGQVTGVSDGVATITYRLTATGCYTTREVTVNPLPVITPVALCEGDTVTMSASPSGGTWSSLNTSVAVLNSATGIITGVHLSHTTIAVAIINYVIPSGCAQTSIVTLNPTPAGLVVAGTAAVCAGNVLTLTSSTPGATWSSNNTAVATVAPTGVVSGVSQGTATISYIFASGCSSARVVTVNPIPTVNPTTGTLSMCRYTTTTLSNTTIDGVWTSSNPTIASITNVGLVTGHNVGTAIISYTRTNEFGCANRALATVSVNPLPIVPTITGTTSVCIGGTSSLTNTTPDGIWTSSNTSVATIGTSGTVTGIASGTAAISYTVTSAFGCTTQVTTQVTVSPPPVVTTITGNLNVCKFDNTNLSNTTPTGVWSSSTPTVASVSTTGEVTGVNLGTTTISYTVSNVLGCSTTVTKVVTVNAIPEISSASGWEICEGVSFFVNSTIPAGTWSSSDPTKATIGIVAGDVTGLSAGNTNITFTVNGSGCFAQHNLLVKNAPTAIPSAPALCKDNTATLTSTPASGTWSSFNPDVVAVNPTSGEITAVINNSTGISFTVITYSLSNGCSKSVTVTVNPHPADIYGASPTLCAGQSTTAMTGTTGGTWSSSNTSVATVSLTGNITSIAAGTTTISYTNSYGCAETETITVNPVLAPISGATSICNGATTTLSNATTGGTWVSSNTSKATINATTGVVVAASTGTTIVTYTAPTGCKATTTITVNATPGLITGSTAICQGASSTLSVVPPSGSWSSSNTSIATINETTGVVAAIAPGTATVSYTNAGGCFRTATVTVNAAPAEITGTAIVCASGATTALSNTSGTWISSNTSVATVNYLGTVTGVNAGNAIISFRNAANCYTSRQVTVNPLPNTFTTPANLCPGSTATITASPSGGTWASNNNAVFTINATTGDMTAVIVSHSSTSLGYVTYTLPTGCKRTAIVTINPVPAAIYGGTTNLCTGNSTTYLSGTVGATWSSSTPAVATTSGSTISGISSGTATISYTNSYGCSAKRIVTVNVTPADITGDNIVTTSAAITLSNATLGGTWTSNNTSKATINNTTGVVSGLSAGTANISYIMSTGCFKTKGISVVAPKNEISIPETTTEISNNFTVYPNPTTGNITIATDNAGTFNIYTMDGKMIETREIKDATTSITLPNYLTAGYYVCQFVAIDGSQKIVRIMYQP